MSKGRAKTRVKARGGYGIGYMQSIIKPAPAMPTHQWLNMDAPQGPYLWEKRIGDTVIPADKKPLPLVCMQCKTVAGPFAPTFTGVNQSGHEELKLLCQDCWDRYEPPKLLTKEEHTRNLNNLYARRAWAKKKAKKNEG